MGLEFVVQCVYTRTFSSESEPPGPLTLLRRLIGTDRIRFVDGRSAITRDSSGFRVAIERGLTREQTCLRFGSAVATVAILDGGAGSAVPLEVRRLATALIMPGEAIRRALTAVGPRVDRIAEIFVVSRVIAAERMQALGLSLASGQFRRPGMRYASG